MSNKSFFRQIIDAILDLFKFFLKRKDGDEKKG